MIWTVILGLGFGSLKDGFPLVTAQLKKEGKTVYQFRGSLPPAPEVEEMQRRWISICAGVKSSRNSSRIKIKGAGKTNISEDNPNAVCEGLKAEMNKWLESDDFFKKIEVKLRTEIRDRSDFVEIFLECDNSKIGQLPWDVWKFREIYCNCEIIVSSPEYGTVTQQATAAGIPLPSQGRILGVSGNSKGIDVEKDIQEITRYLGSRCELQFIKEPTIQELHDNLFDEKGWQVFFYAGHSDCDENVANGLLYINDNDSVTLEPLKGGMKQAIFKGLQLLIFNSCSSLGIATDLVAEGIPLPSVIVMRAPLPDAIAHAFVKSLFRHLALGELLFLAVRKAKDDLLCWERQFPGASGIPVLCQHPTFQELTLPKCGKTHPVIPVESVAGDRPKYRQFTISNKLMQRASISLAALAIGYPFVGPNLALAINTFGMENHRNNQFLIAKASYKLAVLINPTNGVFYYNLSSLCSDLSDRKCEREAMQSAVWRGLPEADAQISKSFLQENKPEDALNSTARCLKNAEYDGVKSACFKNLGLLRLKQKRYDSAEENSRKAIFLNNNSPEAQCLLAKVLEIKGKPQEAAKHWQETLKFANNFAIPEQDECIERAKERLLITILRTVFKQPEYHKTRLKEG